MYDLLKKMLKTGKVTRRQPFKQAPTAYQGTITVDEDLCSHCQSCVESCPVQAISYEGKADSFALLNFDYTSCIFCRLCVEVCPDQALSQTNQPKRPSKVKEGLIESFYLPLEQGQLSEKEDLT